MNWIKNNSFLAGLAGATLVVCAALYFFASGAGTKYAESKAVYDEAYAAVSNSESIALYPTVDNRSAKTKALEDYRESLEQLRQLFAKYRPEKIDNIPPQAFKDQLVAAQKEVSDAFAKAECSLPENFFLGFEGYRDPLARSEATGVLLYQLEGIKTALSALAAAKPTAVNKVYREAVVEENGGTFQPAADQVARFFPFEVTFQGSESSAREFLSALGQTESQYFVVRCVKILNTKDGKPPKVADAKFEPLAPPANAAVPANPFGEAFFTPEEEPAAPAEGADAAEPVVEAPAEPAVDSSRILAQVLGAEEITVFVRFDLSLFLPAKELPKP